MLAKLFHFLAASLRRALYIVAGSFIGAVTLYIYLMTNRADLSAWHTVHLDEEYTVEKRQKIDTFDDYLALEDRLFDELQRTIYGVPSAQSDNPLNRFQAGTLSDPGIHPRNWNRSFILQPEQPRGGVLLLHGLSDSPYSLRTLATHLYEQGYYVLGLRMPGHGTAPSGLVNATWQDMAAAVRLAARQVSEQVGDDNPMYMVGYSMGAAQAVNYSLNALQDDTLRQADALVLISPAIGVSRVAALAVWQSRLSAVPGLQKLAWNSIGPEYDPYKYNSFAVNAGDQMYRLTNEIENKLAALNASDGTGQFPKTLGIMSLVDATVSTRAVVTHLFDRLSNAGNELMIFDINRGENFAPFIKVDPIHDYETLLQSRPLKFDITFFTDREAKSNAVMVHRWLRADGSHTVMETDLNWPDNVYSLSHVALPFPPTDSLYGSNPQGGGLHIGQLVTRGEKGLLAIHPDDMLRLRYNPFYSALQDEIMGFIATGTSPD
ncbi:MAG: alpha/beta fold hydrolase [Oceanicoccus sp.]